MVISCMGSSCCRINSTSYVTKGPFLVQTRSKIKGLGLKVLGSKI